MWPQGWRLKLLTRYAIGNQIRYTAAWAPGTGGEYQIYDAPYAQYRARYDELWPQGWRLKLIDVVVAEPEAETDDLVRIGLALDHAGAFADRSTLSRKSRQCQIEAVPEHMHRRRFA